MMRTATGFAALMSVGGLVYACADVGDSAFDKSNTPGGEAGGLDGSFTAPQSAQGEDGVILVHAAKAQSFRLCFANETDRRPQPDSQVMPEANVVGVEVGSAVRIAPLRGAPGQVFYFSEPAIRSVYPRFGGEGAGPTCKELLAASNPISKLAISLGTIDENLSVGVHVLAVRGCPGDGPIDKYNTADCGKTWTTEKGNLAITHLELRGTARPVDGGMAVQVVNLSQPLESARAGRDVVIRFGDLATTGAPLATVTKNPALFGPAAPDQPAALQYASGDAGVYATAGFRVQLVLPDGGTDAGVSVVLDQTLEALQSLSSPRDVPPTYYAAASTYAVLLLGEPDVPGVDAGAPDERRKLHFLAVPVIEPKPDGGTDGGTDAAATPRGDSG